MGPSSASRTNTVSERLNSRAMAARWLRERIVPLGTLTTASWFPAKGLSVKTSSVVNASVATEGVVMASERDFQLGWSSKGLV